MHASAQRRLAHANHLKFIPVNRKGKLNDLRNLTELIPPQSGSSDVRQDRDDRNDQVTKNMFLQLLVAQIKNQDPMSPSDGAQFLTQLAQFQQLEQSMNMGQDLSAIRSDLDKLIQTCHRRRHINN